MKIVHVITGLGDGGAEAVLYRLCLSESRHRHQVVSLTDEGKYGPLLGELGITVTCLYMSSGRATLRGIFDLYRLLREENPDVVQSWMYHADLIAGFVAKISGVKKIFWNIRNSTLEPKKSSRKTIAVARVCAFASKWIPVGIVSCAKKATEVHVNLGYDEKKIKLISNGYDFSFFKEDDVSRKIMRQSWEAQQVVVLGMVGRFDPQKDHENLFSALSKIKMQGKTFLCVLVGKGMEIGNLQLAELISKYGLPNDVLLLGQRVDIPSIMNALDLHVLSSAYGEAFPNVLAEAMACGTPCVTTDVGDARLIVGNEGWVVPPSNPGLLAEALGHALLEMCDDELWARRRRNVSIRVRSHFDLNKMTDEYRQYWEASVVQ